MYTKVITIMSKISEQFVSHTISKLLEELGFNEACLGAYDEDKNIQLGSFTKIYPNSNECLAPLWQQSLDWLELKNIVIEYHWNSNLTQKWMYQIHNNDQFCIVDCENEFDTKLDCYKDSILKALKFTQIIK